MSDVWLMIIADLRTYYLRTRTNARFFFSSFISAVRYTMCFFSLFFFFAYPIAQAWHFRQPNNAPSKWTTYFAPNNAIVRKQKKKRKKLKICHLLIAWTRDCLYFYVNHSLHMTRVYLGNKTVFKNKCAEKRDKSQYKRAKMWPWHLRSNNFSLGLEKFITCGHFKLLYKLFGYTWNWCFNIVVK